MSKTDAEIARAMAAVIADKGYNLSTVVNKAPRGYWQDVLERVTTAGGVAPGTGKPWKAPALLSNRWKKNQDVIQPILERILSGAEEEEASAPVLMELITNNVPKVEQEIAHNESNVVKEEAPGVDMETIRSLISDAVQALEGRLMDRIQDLAQPGAVMADTETGAVAIIEPPTIPKEGKKFLGERTELATTRVDTVLVERFYDLAKTRFGGNASRAMNAVLYTLFGRPRLSYEDREKII